MYNIRPTINFAVAVSHQVECASMHVLFLVTYVLLNRLISAGFLVSNLFQASLVDLSVAAAHALSFIWQRQCKILHHMQLCKSQSFRLKALTRQSQGSRDYRMSRAVTQVQLTQQRFQRFGVQRFATRLVKPQVRVSDAVTSVDSQSTA